MKMVCVGDCGIDRYQTPVQQDNCGGIAHNFVHHARHQFDNSWDISIITALGDNAAGNRVTQCLEREAIDLHITKLNGNTPVQIIDLQPNGEKKFVHYDEGVLANFTMGVRERGLIQESDLLMTVHFQQIEMLFSSVMNCPSRGLRAVDFADYAAHPSLSLLNAYVDKFDLGFFGLAVSQKQLINELGDFAKAHNKVMVVTLAAAGSIVFKGDKRLVESAVPVSKVIDTTGAGDSFAAGFLSRYCEDKNIQAAMQRGAACAAATIGHLGALER